MSIAVFQAVKGFQILAALVALGGSPQRTPTPDELRLFDEGTHALAAGDAAAAEKAWRAGYEIAHDPAFLVHLGEAEEKAGQTTAAIDSYRRYLREVPDASDRADIEQRLARLAPAAPAPAPAPKVETPGEFGGTPPASPPAPSAAPPVAASSVASSVASPGPTAPHVDTEGPRRQGARGLRMEPLQHHRRHRLGRHARAPRHGRVLRRRGQLEGGRRQPADHLPLPAAAILVGGGDLHQRPG